MLATSHIAQRPDTSATVIQGQAATLKRLHSSLGGPQRFPSSLAVRNKLTDGLGGLHRLTRSLTDPVRPSPGHIGKSKGTLH